MVSVLFVYRNKQLGRSVTLKGPVWTVTMTRKRSEQNYGKHQLFIHRYCVICSRSAYWPLSSEHSNACINDISHILRQRDWNTNLSRRENSHRLAAILWSLVSALIGVRLEIVLDDGHVLAKFPALRVNRLILLWLDILVMYSDRFKLTTTRFDAWSGNDLQ
jgi:hypothetical protein